VELKTDYSRIASQKNNSRSSFFAYLKLGESSLPPIQINYNLFELVQRLNNGYRPNRYDKSSIVMLDEIVEHIVAIAKTSQKLKFYEYGREYSASLEEGMISVTGV
jgi:DNA phosphorothioation-dependent restriction protein DptF